jgi:hypothetical protein
MLAEEVLGFMLGSLDNKIGGGFRGLRCWTAPHK